MYLNDDWIFIINGQLCRTQDFIRSITDQAIIYRLIRYSNEKLAIFSERIDYAFTTPCCSCSRTDIPQLIDETFNQMIILANQAGNVTVINIKSLKIVYDFGNIFQNQPVDILSIKFPPSSPQIISRSVNRIDVLFNILDSYILNRVSSV